jgi:hypothetical protein
MTMVLVRTRVPRLTPLLLRSSRDQYRGTLVSDW